MQIIYIFVVMFLWVSCSPKETGRDKITLRTIEVKVKEIEPPPVPLTETGDFNDAEKLKAFLLKQKIDVGILTGTIKNKTNYYVTVPMKQQRKAKDLLKEYEALKGKQSMPIKKNR